MGLLDQFSNLNPEQTQGLLAAAAQMLQQSGPSLRPTSFGQALGGGLMAYQGATAEAQRRKQQEEQAAQLAAARAQQMEIDALDLSQRQRENQEDQDIRGAYNEAGGDMQKLIESVSRINPMRGMKLREKFGPKATEYDTTVRVGVGADGKPVQYVMGKDGLPKLIDGIAPRDELEFRDGGGAIYGLNKFTGTPVAKLGKTQSPDSKASNAVTIRGQNMLDRRAGQANAAGGKPPAGYRWTPTGELEAIPGGPAGKAAVATEGERKAATLLKRLEGSEQQLAAALAENPGAAKPGVVAQGLRGIGAESLANTVAVGSERQRVESAQLDMLDAALTLGTGAAYTREQLEGYRKSYFPQIGDTPANIKDKEARVKNVIEAAKIAAGRAGGASGDWQAAPKGSKAQPQRKSVMKGQVIDGYRFKGGAPGDQNNWEKI